MSTFKLKEMDTTPAPPPQFSKKPFRRKLVETAAEIWTNTTVEPLMAVIGLTDRINAVAVRNVNLDKACRMNLQYGEAICSALMNDLNATVYHEHRSNCLSLVKDLQSWSQIFLCLFPSLLLLLIGPYSDRTKHRKTFLLVPFLGYCAMSLGLILSSVYFEAIPLVYNFMIESVFLGLFGHYIVLYMSVYTYISTITVPEERSFRIGLIAVINTMFNLIGSAVGRQVMSRLGYVGSFSVVFLLYVSCFLYTYFLIPEVTRSHLVPATFSPNNPSNTVPPTSEHLGFRSHFVGFVRDFFDFANVREMFEFLFRPESDKEDPKKQLKIILILINVAILIDHDFPFLGEKTVLILYTKHTFQWNEINYSIFHTIFFLTDFIGSMFCIFFFIKTLTINDSIVGIISVVSTLCGLVIFASASTSFIFCFGALVSLFSDACFTAMRAMISKLTTASELGKAMAAFMLFEAMAPLIYEPLYLAVYETTVDVWSSAFLTMSLFLAVPALVIFIWFYHTEEKLKARLKHQRESSIITETGSQRRNDDKNDGSIT